MCSGNTNQTFMRSVSQYPDIYRRVIHAQHCPLPLAHLRHLLVGKKQILRFVVWIPHQALAPWKASLRRTHRNQRCSLLLLPLVGDYSFGLCYFFSIIPNADLHRCSIVLPLSRLHQSTTVAYPTTHTHIVLSSYVALVVIA